MKIGLCLSGGGIKGAAHIGALKALEEENIKIDCIAGTSSGSIVSAMYAMGYKPEKIYELFKRYGKEASKINFTTIMKLVFGLIFRRKIIIEGLNSGKSLYKIVQEQANKKSINKIKDIKMPLIIPSVNLYNGEIYLFSSLEQNRTYSDEYIVENNIEIGKAVQASCSYPGVFCPTNYKGKKMVDGGLRENTPWKELQQIGADKIISKPLLFVILHLHTKACGNLLQVHIAQNNIVAVGNNDTHCFSSVSCVNKRSFLFSFLYKPFCRSTFGRDNGNYPVRINQVSKTYID